MDFGDLRICRCYISGCSRQAVRNLQKYVATFGHLTAVMLAYTNSPYVWSQLPVQTWTSAMLAMYSATGCVRSVCRSCCRRCPTAWAVTMAIAALCQNRSRAFQRRSAAAHHLAGHLYTLLLDQRSLRQAVCMMSEPCQCTHHVTHVMQSAPAAAAVAPPLPLSPEVAAEELPLHSLALSRPLAAPQQT